jgi:chromosomal replication initiator protein
MNEGDAQVRKSAIKSIQEVVAHLFGLSVEELRGGGARRAVAVPRNIAIYVTRQLTDASHLEIGQHFGGRHHSTVMNSIAKIEEQRRTNIALDRVVCRLLKSLGPASKVSRTARP